MSIVDNITKGIAKIKSESQGLETTVNVENKRVAQFKSFGRTFKDATENERYANCQLYIDAHNTANKCGKLTSELLAENIELEKQVEHLQKLGEKTLEQRNELLEALKEVNENFSIWDLLPSKQQEKIHDLITKATTP